MVIVDAIIAISTAEINREKNHDKTCYGTITTFSLSIHFIVFNVVVALFCFNCLNTNANEAMSIFILLNGYAFYSLVHIQA